MHPLIWTLAVLATGPSQMPGKVAPQLQDPAQAGAGDGQAAPEATVSEPVVPPTADDDQKPPSDKPGFGGTFILDNDVPSGAFITNNAYTYNPALSTNLYLRPHYTFKAFGQTLRAQVWENFYFADVLDKNTVTTRQFDWSDARLSLYDDKIWTEPHSRIEVSGYVRGSIPLSYQSQYESKITTLSTGFGLAKNLYGFNLQTGLNFGKNFNRLTSAQFPCSASVVGPVASVPGEAPDISSIDLLQGFQNGICRSGNPAVAPSFMNVDWSMSYKLGATYNFTDKLQASLTFYYIDQFYYPISGSAAYNAPIVDSNGNPVVTMHGRVDGIWGITEVAYALTDHWGLSLGLWNGAGSTGAPPKTATGGTFRFPFLDTYSLNSNDWDLYFDVTATF